MGGCAYFESRPDYPVLTTKHTHKKLEGINVWNDQYCYQECYGIDIKSNAMAGWRCWLHWVGPPLTSGCLSSLCKNAVLCPPTWRPPVLAPSTPTPARWFPLCSVHGSPSRQPSGCACRRPGPGGNNEPALPVKKSQDHCLGNLMKTTTVLW